jgi:fructokinase
MKQVTSIGEILFDVYPDRRTLGGAPFNFIYHIIKLTGKGSFVSRIGNDPAGNAVLKFLTDKGIPKKHIQIDSFHPTGESVAFLDKKKIPVWKIKTGTAYDFIELNDEIEQLINNNTDCLYFGTLAQRDIKTRSTIQHLFNRNLKYFCDLNIRQDFYSKNLIHECLKACDVLKLNIDEFHLVNNLLLNKNFVANKSAERLQAEYGISLLCITYGDQGATIYQGNRSSHYELKMENVVDTVGAGDAYAAIFCIGYLNNWDIEKINEIASAFAGEIVKINGALPEEEILYEKYKQVVDEFSEY